jgi:methylenetetrahydrofolate reductase (NADPH)
MANDMKISVELVPRGTSHLLDELTLIKNNFGSINTINVPDLLRLPMRSWEGTGIAKTLYDRSIPHIRAIDFSLKEDISIAAALQEYNIMEVLVVSGDPPTDMSRTVYPTSSTEFIRKMKMECPWLKVYAAIDPYRSSVRAEYEYIERKREAGADGFFTQPFFDLRLMEIYAELLEGQDVFWGVAPVMTEKSRLYWETKNYAVFPRSFEPSLAWNTNFARQALEFSRKSGGSIYFMPIKTDLYAYLNGIFS